MAWTSAIIVFGVIFLELFVLGVLLLPLPAFILGPATQILKKMMHHYILWFYILVVIFLFFDSVVHMYNYENREEPEEHMAKQQHLLSKFRAERNFYMNLFAFILMILIIRVRQMVSTLTKQETELRRLEEFPNKKNT